MTKIIIFPITRESKDMYDTSYGTMQITLQIKTSLQASTIIVQSSFYQIKKLTRFVLYVLKSFFFVANVFRSIKGFKKC